MKKTYQNKNSLLQLKSDTSEQSVEQVIRDIHKKNNGYWMKERETRALKLFHEVAERVPAYKDFLKKK